MALRLDPLYLVHGDDHAGISERRSRLRTRVEGEGGSVELLEGDAATPAGAAQALATMTLAAGRRVIVVDGAERWRKDDFERDLAGALDEIPPETTLVLFAREDPRVKLAPAILERLKKGKARIDTQMAVKPWELPRWVAEQAARMGLELDKPAAQALVRQVGDRPQRLLRELEKLALEVKTPAPIDAEHIEARAAHSAEWKAYALADALVGGDTAQAVATYMGVREQGESPAGLVYLMARRLREALDVSLRLQAGESAAQVKRSLRLPQRAAERLVADASRCDPDRLRRALVVLADLELDSRGGAVLLADRSPLAPLGEDTIALRAIAEITA
jgi:DNA polymerase III subunit delta